MFGLFDQQQLLRHEPAADRDDHAPAWAQLLDQRRWYVTAGCRHDDGIERRMLFPAIVAVTKTRRNIVVTETLEPRFGLVRQRRNDLNAVNVLDETRQNGRLVSGTGANLQHDVVLVRLNQVCHQRHDVGLRYGLAVPDRQGPILIGKTFLLVGNELVPCDDTKRPQNPFGNSLAPCVAGEACIQLDLGNHVGPLGCEAGFIRTACP